MLLSYLLVFNLIYYLYHLFVLVLVVLVLKFLTFKFYIVFIFHNILYQLYFNGQKLFVIVLAKNYITALH